MLLQTLLKWQLACWSIVFVLSCITASAQSPPASLKDCIAGTDYEAQGYTIRDARIEDPWQFLRFRHGTGDAADEAVRALKGKAYKKADIDEAEKIVREYRAGSAELQVLFVEVSNCVRKELDLTFKVFAVQISPVISNTFEFRQKEKSDPETAAGIKTTRYTLTPLAGYDQTDKLFAGGTLEVHRSGNSQLVDSMSLTGYGSSSTHLASAAITGGYESATRGLARADWRLEYLNSSLPTDSANLKQGRLSLQGSGTTHPLRGVVLRFGASIEGGNQQSDFISSDLAPTTLASSGYSSLKIYGGITAHPRHQALTASYGLEFGSTGKSFHGDWRKQIGDIAHEFWFPFGNHRLIEVEQRFTVGRIHTLRTIPVGALFFGGNREKAFISGDDWSIRANPVIRSIPANRFDQTDAGRGATRFASYNSTFGFTVWRSPLVPKELNDDPTFHTKLNGALVSATSILQVAYQSDDQNFRDALKLLPTVDKHLQALRVAVTNAGAEPSEDCTDALGSSQSLVKHALADKPVQAFGSVKELLPNGEGALSSSASLCTTGATAQPILNAAADLNTDSNTLQKLFNNIDLVVAQKRATADMSYVKRTLDIILQELNIASVSPVFIFDAAHIGPANKGPYSGTRYGVGGGLRFSLLNMVNVTSGYAWNPDRRDREVPGAIFFSLSTRNLFR
jgi:hypothetical protein